MIFLGFAVRPDEAYVYASMGISDPHRILGHVASGWGGGPMYALGFDLPGPGGGAFSWAGGRAGAGPEPVAKSTFLSSGS